METKTNTPTTAPGIEIADSKRNEDVNTIYAASDTLNGLATDFKKMLASYGYPSIQLADLTVSLSNVNEELQRAANFILNPAATDLDPEVERRIKCGID